MKKNIGKRILSLALALVMVAGWLPRMATEAHAAEPITLEDNTFTTSPGQGFAFRAYFYCHECGEYVYTDSNTENHNFEITSFTYKIANGTAEWNLTANYQGCRGSGTGINTYSCSYNCTEKLNRFLLKSYGWDPNTRTYHGAICVYITREKTTHQGDATCKTAKNCTLCGTSYTNASNHEKPDEFTYSVNTSDSTKHDKKYACCGATMETVVHTAEPTYTVNATDHTKHDKTYSCCEGIAETTGHSYTYAADSFVLTETCSNGCGHQAIASIVAGEAIYTGSEITDAATISYDSGTWAGATPVLSYENNVKVGTATAKMTAGGATASTTFKINPANLSNVTVTLDPASGIYNGELHSKPSYNLTYNGKELDEGTDYIVDGQWTGDFLNAGSHNLVLEGKGNFTGTKTLTYTIGKATPTANLFEMALPQNPVYDGTTTFPVTVTPKTTDLGEITAVKYNGSTEAPINAGTYKVTVNVEEGKNYNAIYDLELGSFTVAPTAGSIIIPANQSVVYDGAAVEQSDLTPAITTDGALTVKWYDSEGNEITAPADVGTYQIGISAAAGSNYNAVDEVKQTFTITKADPICTAPAARAGLVYNGKEQYLITPAESMDGTVYYSLDGDNYTESLPKGTNAQGYTVYYKVVGDANHNDMEPKTVTATIAPFNIGTASCKAGVRGEPFTYNGQEHTPTPQIDVWVNDYPVPGNPYAPGADVRLTKDTDYTVTYSNNVNAGQAVVTFTGKGNYTGTITKNFTIDPKELDGSAVSIPVVSLPYTGEAQTVAIVVPEGVTYELVEGTMTATNAGMYGFTIQFTGNHTGISTQGWQITAVAPNATAPTANTLTYNGEDQALIAAGATNDGTMVYSLEKEGEYKAELPKAKTAGTYHVWYKVIGDGNHTDSAPASVEVKIDKADPGIGIVTAGVVNDTLETYAIVLTRENTDIPGNLTVDAEQTLAWGDNTIRYTFTPEDTTNYKVVKGEVTVTVVDTVAPTGTVTVSTKSWTEFLNNITFGLFFKETQTVSVNASDNLSGVAKIEYIESKTALDLEAVKAATQWTEMKNGSVSVTLEDTKQFVYYIRITDKAGNVAYLSSDGAEYDTTAPVLYGMEDGGVYHGDKIFKAIDDNFLKIEVDGVDITDTTEGDDEFKIVADNAEHTVTVTDKAGNVTEYKITVYKRYMATFTDGDGGSYEKNFNYGEVITIPTNEFFKDTFRKTGYTVKEWQGYTEGMTMPLKDLTFTAVYAPCEYTVTFDQNGGEVINPLTVTFGEKYGSLPSSAITGLSGGNKNWYLVDADGNVTETNIKNLTIVSTARDHRLFIKRNVLAPNVSIALTVPGGISDGYQYYIPGASNRVLTATVGNMNTDVLDYTYQWYKDGTIIEGATSNVLTLDGNVSDSGTYKVEVTATLKDGTNIVVTSNTATASKEQKVKILHATNTLSYDANGGEGGPQSSYTGGTNLNVSKEAPTKEHHIFIGWNTAPDGTGDSYKAEDAYTFANDNGNGGCVVTLYAQWKLVEYTVTYVADGEAVSTEMVGHGKDATLPAVPAKDGYVGKWDSDGKNITGDTTITAVYTVIPVVKPDEVKPEDKTDLEDTKKQLEEMLKDDSYTDDDKKDIQDAIDDIDDALKVIGNVEAVEELIDKLPENITGNDGDAIKAADDAYNALSDYEKSLVDEAAKKALTDAKAALAELNKPADPNSPATGDNSNMFLWIALLFISGGAVITLTVVDRKKRMASKR